MIVRKIISVDRKTGKKISEVIVGKVDMTRDEYWEPLARELLKTEPFQKMLREIIYDGGPVYGRSK